MGTYTRKLTELLPDEARELSCRDEGAGRTETPARVIELRRWGPSFEPLDFQRQVISGIGRLTQEKCVNGLLSLPTGAGKTLTASWLVLDAMSVARLASANRPVFSLWIAPQRELLYQASEALQSAWWSGKGPDSLNIEIIESHRDYSEARGPTCLLMTPMMARSLIRALSDEVTALVFDEAHHVAANKFGKVWSQLRAKGQPRLSLGLSATPTRTDESEVVELRDAFDKTLFLPELLGTTPTESLIRKGVLAHPTFRIVEGVPKFERWKGASDRRSLQSLVSSRDRWLASIKRLQDNELGQTVVYALDRQHGKALTRHLRYLGAQAEYIDGETPYEDRVGVLERFRDGSTRILINVALLIEGVDCPAAESVFLTYPVESEIMYRQMVGRVLRGPVIGGTEKCEVWAVEGSQERMDRRLFGSGLSFAGWQIKMLS